MTFQAFAGSPGVKAQMIEPIREQWNAGALVPAVSLRWNSDGETNSISGALAQTEDRQEFEQRSGIPADLAQLCEHLVATGLRTTPAAERAASSLLDAADPVLVFGTEWLDAIRPGADLSLVVPQFARYCLNRLVAPEFELAAHIRADLREVALAILSLWDRELEGQATPRGDWRELQRKAMIVTARDTDPWSYRITAFVEAVAWPVRSVSREFVGLFEPFLFNWLMHLENGFMTEVERKDREHFLLGMKAMATAPRDEAGHIDFDPLENLPEAVRVTSADHISQTMDRMVAVREAARAPKDEVVRGLMDTVLTLIRGA